MRCPHCNHPEDHVIDSRPVETANMIRRRRECLSCNKRFTTYERHETIPLIVLKSDNRREPFSRDKLRDGINLACKNCNISADLIEKLVSEVELELQEEYVLEAPSRIIGDLVLKKLKDLDLVAYIRFVSVYRQFSDLDSFLNEVKDLKSPKSRKKKPKNATVNIQNLTASYSEN